MPNKLGIVSSPNGDDRWKQYQQEVIEKRGRLQEISGIGQIMSGQGGKISEGFRADKREGIREQRIWVSPQLTNISQDFLLSES